MHIKSLIFASVSFLGSCLAYAITSIDAGLSYALERWPEYQPATASESIALDTAARSFELQPSPMERAMAFARRALSHSRYIAGGFIQGEPLAAT